MEIYIPRFFNAPAQSFFLFGPRGTGKSTYLRKNYPDALWVDLLAGRVIRKTLHPFLPAELENYPFEISVKLDFYQ
jgi:predicted AAA+ superfamily ATPase